jgi:sulfur relay (sulfurtransferase) DsrF/TusC family protein
MQNLIAVLYSKEQKCWHIETLMEYLLSNQRFLLDVTKVQQYRLVCLFNTIDEADIFIDKNRDMFRKVVDKI